ncbi:MAG: hypothetical protein C0410_14030 [Anaerolinea sp.]|nr:hypothetical protein [Anaerolinea sp.]
MKKCSIIIILVFLLSSCQDVAGTATPDNQPTITTTAMTQPGAQNLATQAPLSAFMVDLSKPLVTTTLEGQSIELQTWEENLFTGIEVPLPLSISSTSNPEVVQGLTAEENAFLQKNGFVVIHSQEPQFGDISKETAKITGQPYYLTTDAAYHALHLNFDEILKSIERGVLRSQIISITRATLEKVSSSLSEVEGTSLEKETLQAMAYLSVALKLFNPEEEINSKVKDIVTQQVEQILAAGGSSFSVLFPEFKDDYGAYKPVGHYEGDPDLEAYFRGMTWFGRMHFRLQNPDQPGFIPSRVPLIITLAMRRAEIDNRPVSELWGEIYQLLNFIIGPSDDAGPLEYATLMDKVYGDSLSLLDLADDEKWNEFQNQGNLLPAPQINSLFVVSTVDLAQEIGWRFMGQRFTMDGLIFQNLIFDKVKQNAEGQRRDIPSGLDVMAAFGSAPALQELEAVGANNFQNYPEQMAKMQTNVQSQPEHQWLSRFYDGWLYSFIPVLKEKKSAYPVVMQTNTWAFREMNSVLGSWAELKHDTILYTKMPEGAGGGGPPRSNPAPSYVEPNPQAFYRLAYIARVLAADLEIRLMNYSEDAPSEGSSVPMWMQIRGMNDLADSFSTFGDIAAKELSGVTISEEENWVITDCLGVVECMSQESASNIPKSEMPKPPVIAAVSGAGDNVLEVGVGYVDRIYVVVPLENTLEIAQGGVFSYYEFSQPRDQRLTDDEWRAKLADGSAPPLPSWAKNFVFMGGTPTQSLVFRKNDVYIINQAGDKLNMRSEPSVSGKILSQLTTDDYVEIIDGPMLADGFTWWKIKTWAQQEIEGWVVENPEWFVRSYSP